MSQEQVQITAMLVMSVNIGHSSFKTVQINSRVFKASILPEFLSVYETPSLCGDIVRIVC